LRLDGHSGPVVSLFLSDNWLFSGSVDTTINCWNAANGEVLRKYIGHSHPVYTVAIFDGELYSTASVTELFKWGIEDAELRKKFTDVHEQQIYCLAYKSQHLFTGSYDTTVIRWNVVSGDALFIYSGRKSFIRGVVSWKNFLISGGDDAVIRIWDSSTEAIDPYAVIDNNHVRINSLFILDYVLYFGDSDGNIRVISLPTFTLITTFERKIKSIQV
jgi:WD40 repeat protein